MLFHFQWENNPAATTTHSPAHKNAPVQHSVFQQVHVVILNFGSTSGRTTKDTPSAWLVSFTRQSLQLTVILSHSCTVPTVQSCKPKNTREFHLSLCSGDIRGQVPALGGSPFPQAVQVAVALKCHWPPGRQSDLCFVVLMYGFAWHS